MTRPEDGQFPAAHADPGVRLDVLRGANPGVLAGAHSGVLRLKKRADFVAVAKGRRQHQKNFVLQARERDLDPRGRNVAPPEGDMNPDAADSPRLGFTVTKKVGNSVVRNRIRRRLREAARLAEGAAFAAGCDYVLVARREALSASFDELRGDLAHALKKIHRAGQGRPPAAPARDTRGRKQDL
jgi:ribonuclease P protein component